MDTLFILMTVTILNGYCGGASGVQYSQPMKYEECVRAKELTDRLEVQSKILKIVRKK